MAEITDQDARFNNVLNNWQRCETDRSELQQRLDAANQRIENLYDTIHAIAVKGLALPDPWEAKTDEVPPEWQQGLLSDRVKELREAKEAAERKLKPLIQLACDINRIADYDWFIPCTLPESCGKFSERHQDVLTCIACALKTELIGRTLPYTDALAQIEQPQKQNADDCYCVCHTPISSCAACRHCRPDLFQQPQTAPAEEREDLYQITDRIISEELGQPNEASGHYLLDAGNIQSLVHKIAIAAGWRKGARGLQK